MEALSSARMGLPRVVSAPDKTPENIAELLLGLAETQRCAIATRVEPHIFEAVQAILGGELVVRFVCAAGASSIFLHRGQGPQANFFDSACCLFALQFLLH